MARMTARRAAEELRAKDRTMARLVEQYGPPRLRESRHAGGAFPALARAICHQQLAGRAAAAIHARFEALFDGEITPVATLALPEERLRAAGLSTSKARSIRDLAARAIDGTVPLASLSRQDDDEIVRHLVQVRGVGPWTAEMFLIFQLGRLDVWPVQDYGVRKGYALAYRRPALPASKDLARLGARFRPYRSVAAWYLWRVADG